MLPHLEIVLKNIIFSNDNIHCQMDVPNLFNQSFIGYLDKLQFFPIISDTDGHSRVPLSNLLLEDKNG